MYVVCAATQNATETRHRTAGRRTGVSPAVTTFVKRLETEAETADDMVVIKLTEHNIRKESTEREMLALLGGMTENSTCQGLYMQGYAHGSTDRVLAKLCEVLMYSRSSLWCLNLGELDKISGTGWEHFVTMLPRTMVTHMYISENVAFSRSMKKKTQEHLRENRKKHTLHSDCRNQSVILQCIACWWNPWNANVFKADMFHKRNGARELLRMTFSTWRRWAKKQKADSK
jgi:hypothetical protein